MQFRSARRFQKTSPLFRWAEERGDLNKAGRALVFGAGHLGEATALSQMSWQVDAVELPESVALRPEVYADFDKREGCRVLTSLQAARKAYDLVLVTHVLEFVESPKERRETLRDLGRRLASNGKLLLSLRGWSDVNAAKKRTPRGDGVVTGLGTWTRGFTTEEAEKLLASAGLTVSANPRSTKSKSPEQVRLVCQRL